MAVWPASLPQDLQASPGLDEQPPDVMLETQMDAGPPKARRRFTAGFRPIKGTVEVTITQRNTLDDFFVNTLAGGTLPFDWKHPTTGAAATFRFVKNGLKYKQTQPTGVNTMLAELDLRLMP